MGKSERLTFSPLCENGFVRAFVYAPADAVTKTFKALKAASLLLQFCHHEQIVMLVVCFAYFKDQKFMREKFLKLFQFHSKFVPITVVILRGCVPILAFIGAHRHILRACRRQRRLKSGSRMKPESAKRTESSVNGRKPGRGHANLLTSATKTPICSGRFARRAERVQLPHRHG